MIAVKPLCIRFNKVDRFYRAHDGSRYSILFRTEKYDAIYNRIRYFISRKSNTTYAFSNSHEGIIIDSYDLLPPEKSLTLHNVIILIKSFLKKTRNHYYYKYILREMFVSITPK